MRTGWKSATGYPFCEAFAVQVQGRRTNVAAARVVVEGCGSCRHAVQRTGRRTRALRLRINGDERTVGEAGPVRDGYIPVCAKVETVSRHRHRAVFRSNVDGYRTRYAGPKRSISGVSRRYLILTSGEVV